jgi:hypothetical protein
MKHTLVHITLLFAALTTHAQGLMPETIGLHLGSKHSSYKQDWNDANFGVYARWGNGITLGTLRNSERAQSYYAGWTGDWSLTKRIDAGLTLGLITGYKRAPVLPMVVPSLRLAVTENLGLRTSYIFNPDRQGAHVLHISAEWKF